MTEVQEFPFQHNRHNAFWFTSDVDGDGTINFLASETVGVAGSPALQGKPLLRALHLDPAGVVKGAGTTLRWRHSRAKGGRDFERRPVHHYFVGVNGDGLLDDVMTTELVELPDSSDPDVDPERTSRPFLALNTGNGFAEVTEALLEPSSAPLQGLLKRWKILQDLRGGNVQAMDLDQDGRQDLLLLDDGDGNRAQPVVYMAQMAQGEPGALIAAHPLPPGQANVDPSGAYFTARTLVMSLSKKGVLRAASGRSIGPRSGSHARATSMAMAWMTSSSSRTAVRLSSTHARAAAPWAAERTCSARSGTGWGATPVSCTAPSPNPE